MADDQGQRKLLSVPEVAELLHVSVKSVREHVRAGHIPSLKVGHLRRFNPASLEKWIADQEEPARNRARRR
jgi:excisionase family DNA binding protein